jgi:hypothetical protein
MGGRDIMARIMANISLESPYWFKNMLFGPESLLESQPAEIPGRERTDVFRPNCTMYGDENGDTPRLTAVVLHRHDYPTVVAAGHGTDDRRAGRIEVPVMRDDRHQFEAIGVGEIHDCGSVTVESEVTTTNDRGDEVLTMTGLGIVATEGNF